ncbi:MAG: nitrilase family protein, partial [Muribaculaceae bacterium]|nr:nitrilase family protein [Muribaculaceae bacterium]
AVALEALSQARAIENQAYVVVANRSGSDEYGEYDGLSFVDDYIGTRVVTAPAGEIVYATADREGLQKLRDYMPAGLDSDTFTIKY